MHFIVELLESGGNMVIWTVNDLFLKQAYFTSCTGLSSSKKWARMFIKQIYRLHGVPHQIISDSRVQFTAKFWKEFLRVIGSNQDLSSTFHMSTNGGAEQGNTMAEQYFRCYVDYQQSDWANLLPFWK